MKKFFYILTAFLFTCALANAETVNFMNQEYHLEKVLKNSPNIMNAYIAHSQKIENWTDLITVQYLPKEESEFDYINNFINTLSKNPEFRLIGFNSKDNTFSFGLMYGKGNEGYIEYNLVKCKMAKNGGISAIQYSHRYHFNDKASFLAASENCFKNDNKYASAILNTKIPAIVKKQK